jgi:ribosomal protein S18 acetylase RimI-like enzyme
LRVPLLSERPAIRALLSENGWAHRIGDEPWFDALLSHSRCVVALDGAQVVGFARAVTDGLSNGYLSMVVVAATHRRRGLGRRLVSHIMGSEEGITWMLRAERPGAREFFGRLGFVPSSSAMQRVRRAGLPSTSDIEKPT